jgi:hypothetical protein
LPGVAPDWFETISKLGPNDPPFVVWHR